MSAAVDVTPTAASKNSANHITTTSDVDPAIPRTNAVVAGSDDPAAGSHTLEALSHDLRRRVDAFLDLDTGDAVLRSTQNQVRVARDVIDEALRRYRPEELSLSYNGGKDCLVLLVLILASLPSHFPPSSASTSASTSAPSVPSPPTSKPTDQNASSSSPSATATRPFPTSFQALYIRPPSPFPEVDAFVASSTAYYHLDLATSDLPMKPALTEYLHDTSISQSKSHPQSQSQSQSKTEVNGDGKQGRGVKAVFVGTRRTDPHGALLTHFDETDADWPRFMRIHPVIDWHYREVWRFIRALDIPYCPLYDMGYTSLGGTNDTHPNPALRRSEKQIAEGRSAFRPAYELMEDDEERLGRDR